LRFGCRQAANIIKGKSVNEIRARSITKSEEEQVRKENECCKESEYFCKKIYLVFIIDFVPNN